MGSPAALPFFLTPTHCEVCQGGSRHVQNRLVALTATTAMPTACDHRASWEQACLERDGSGQGAGSELMRRQSWHLCRREGSSWY